MENLNLISNFAEFKELKNIDKSTMIGVLEDVFRHALQKQFESDENFDVIINPEKGDLEIWRNREVVEDGAVENPNMQIAVSEVKAIDATYEVGDEYADQIKMNQFGRRAVLSLRQNLASRLLDLDAIIWNGEFLHLSAIEPVKTRDRTEIRAAICLPVTLTAKPQDRTGRDELNRPVAIKQAEFRFPGVLAEMYHRNESDEVYRTTTQRRVLVTPKEISLRVGDLVQYEEESAYTVRQVMDLEAHKNEYIIERQEDV